MKYEVKFTNLFKKDFKLVLMLYRLGTHSELFIK